MGHYSKVSGTLVFKSPLTPDQTKKFMSFIATADRERDGSEDWWLAEGGLGLVSRWEDSFKAYDTLDGLRKVLVFLREMGVGWEGGQFFRREGDGDGPDVEDWLVADEDGVEVEELGPTLVLDAVGFVDEFMERVAENVASTETASKAMRSTLLTLINEWYEAAPTTMAAMSDDYEEDEDE